jgi:hypothetical protein
MNRRRSLVLSLAVVVVGLSAGVWLLWPRTAITRENAARIQKGMTRVEVLTILGGPPRDESNGRMGLDDPDEDNAEEMRHERLRQWIDSRLRADFDPDGGPRAKWQSNQVVIYIWWDEAGTVEDCDVFPLRRAPEGPLAMFCRCFGL